MRAAQRATRESCCSPFYVKGVSLGHVGRNLNLKDLKARDPANLCSGLNCGSVQVGDAGAKKKKKGGKGIGLP